MKRYIIKSDNNLDDFKDTLEDVGYDEEEWSSDDGFDVANLNLTFPLADVKNIKSPGNISQLEAEANFEPFYTEYHNCCIAQANHKFILFTSKFPRLFTIVSGYHNIYEMEELLRKWYDFDNEMHGNSSFDYVAEKEGYNVETSENFNSIWS